MGPQTNAEMVLMCFGGTYTVAFKHIQASSLPGLGM